MKVVHSRKVRAVEPLPRLKTLLEMVSDRQFHEWVERISVPRHFQAEQEQNRATARWLCDVFDSMGFRVERQGRYSNVLAFPQKSFEEMVLVGAHYDSVPMCPAADDNGSAVAAMLGCAAACSLWQPVFCRSSLSLSTARRTACWAAATL
ncbi:MAG: M28 family peptidase [Verrucomicrobiota bacterium]